jgi:hypothetical protein
MSGFFSKVSTKRKSTEFRSSPKTPDKTTKIEIFAFAKFSVMEKMINKEIEFKDVDLKWRTDYDVALCALGLKGSDIQYCGPELLNDRTFALLAVSRVQKKILNFFRKVMR